MTELRLLLLLPFVPRLDAAHGGGRVLSQFLSEITVRHRVAILCFREAGEPGADPFFRERCELIEEVIRPASETTPKLLRYLQLMISLIRLRPFWVNDWSSRVFAKKARDIARRFQPDVIQVEFHIMGQYLSALGDTHASRILVQHEAGARAAPYIQNLPAAFAGLLNRMDKLSWRRYEAGIYRQVDSIVVFTEADHRSVREAAGHKPIHIIPPGTVIPQHALNPFGDLPLSLLFIGNFIHPPNVEAARQLVNSIFPLVRERVPGIKLFIVGDHAPADLSGENVIVTGRVPDVIPYLDQAALFVAPMRLGGGLRIKILEALAAGKAVIATPLAIEGLNLGNGDHVSLAESDVEFVERIVYFLERAESRASLARNARAWACDHISWEASIRKYDALYNDLLAGSAD
jgi:polysaccharide biosynthesis protein PslH